jgi:hypothetical protein
VIFQRKQRDNWQQLIDAEIERLIADDPPEITITLPTTEEIMTERLQYAQRELRRRGYSMRSAHQYTTPAWTADFVKSRS